MPPLDDDGADTLPPFDPSKPFTIAPPPSSSSALPAFDPSKPFTVAGAKDEPSVAASIGHGALEAAGPGLGGIAGGAATGAALGGLGFGPLGVLGGGLAGAIATAAGLQYGQSKALEAMPGVAKTLGLDPETRAAEEKAHPYWRFGGNLAGGAMGLSPGMTAAKVGAEAPALARAMGTQLGGRGFSSIFMGGQEAISEKLHGEDFDPYKVALSTAFGAGMPSLSPLGKKAAAVGEAPVRMWHGEPAFPSAPAAPPAGDTSGAPATPPPSLVTPEQALQSLQNGQADVARWEASLAGMRGAEGYVPNTNAENTVIAQLNRAKARVETAKGILEQTNPEILGHHPQGRDDQAKTPEEAAADNARAAVIREGEAQQKAADEGNLDLRGKAPSESPAYTEEDWTRARSSLVGKRKVGPLGLEGEASREGPVWTEEDLANIREAWEAAQQQRQPSQGGLPLQGEAPQVEITAEDISHGRELAQKQKAGELGLEGTPQNVEVTADEIARAAATLAIQRWRTEGVARPTQGTMPLEAEGARPPISPSEMATVGEALRQAKKEREEREAVYDRMPTQPNRLVEFLSQIGGLNDEGGEVSHITGTDKYRTNRPGRFSRYLIKKEGGLSLDAATMKAWEEGYFPEKPVAGGDRPTTDELLDAIREDIGGQPRYSHQDNSAADLYHRALDYNHEVDRVAQKLGIDPKEMGREEFWDEVHRRLPPEAEDAIAAEGLKAQDENDRAVIEGDIPFEFSARTIEEVERDRRSQEPPFGVGQGEADLAQPRNPAPDQGQGQEGAGQAGPRPAAPGDQAESGQSGQGFELTSPEAKTREFLPPDLERTSQGVQQVMPGMERSAQQAAAARDAEGRGKLGIDKAQEEPGGLFEKPEEKGPELPIGRSEVPTFYSALTRSVEDLNQPKAPGGHWANIIKNLSQKGVKQDEIEWSGVLDWLKDHPGAVTKEQLLDFLRMNEVQVEDVVRGSRGEVSTENRTALQSWIADHAAEQYKGELLAAERGAANGNQRDISILRDWGLPDNLVEPYRQTMFQPKYESYTLPGGENYRELLLTWPMGARNMALRKEVYDRFQPEIDQARHDYDDLLYRSLQADLNDYASSEEHSRDLTRRQDKIDRLIHEREQVAKDAGFEDITHDRNHWGGTENVLAHIRFDDRTDPQGNKILHIAEMQSDWHQQGRKYGYKDKAEVDAAAKRAGDALKVARGANKELQDRLPALEQEKAFSLAEARKTSRWTVEDKNTGQIVFGTPTDRIDAERWMINNRQPGRELVLGYGADENFAAFRRYRELMEEHQALSQRVTDAESSYHAADEAHGDLVRSQYDRPQKGPLANQWHETAMKRVLRYAAENGYDKVSWDTGATQANRYDLSHHIDQLDWVKNPDGTVSLSGVKNDREVFHQDDLTPAKLADTVGKDVADRIMREDGKHWEMHPDYNMGQLKDAGLQVGGEGMRGFYDKILPAFLNKYAKKWGAKVEAGEIETAPANPKIFQVYDHWGAHVRDFPTLEGANHFVADPANGLTGAIVHMRGGVSAATSSVHSIDITDPMRESVTAKGQPLWQPGAVSAEAGEYRFLNRDFADFYLKGDYPKGAFDLPAMHTAARDYVLDRGKTSGNEHAVLVHPELGALTATTSDNAQMVNWGHRLIMDPEGHLSVHHNHPIEASLSPADVSALGYPGVSQIVAHGHDGGTFAAQLTDKANEWLYGDKPPKDPVAAIRNIWTKAYDIIAPALRMQQMAGKIDAGDRYFMEADLTNRALQAAGLLDYRSPYGSFPLPDSVRDSIVRRAGEAAAGNARKYGLRLDSGEALNANIHIAAQQRSSDSVLDWVSGEHAALVANPEGRPGEVSGTGRDTAGQEGTGAAAEGQTTGLARLEQPARPEGEPEKPSWLERARQTLGQVGRGGDSAIANGIKEVMQSVVPMATGTDRAMVKTTDFAVAERHARAMSSYFFGQLKKLSPAESRNMYDTISRASVAAQLHGDEAALDIIKTLPDKQQKTAHEMEAYGIDLWEAGRQTGVVAPDAVRIPWYMTRMILNLEKPGQSEYLKWGSSGDPGTSLDRLGINLTTQGPRRRLYLTPEETEAAAKAIDPHAEIIRDARTLPLALERFERAIAGRRLVNDIKDIGYLSGKETVIEGEARPGYFTIEHPALRQPVARRDADGQIIHDENGDIVYDRKAIYVADELKGPVKAILREAPSAPIKMFNQLKGGAMSMVLFSPTMHNFVIYGKAFPGLPHKFLFWKNYTEGNAYRNDPANLRQMVMDGVVPISGRGYRQDLTGIADEPVLGPGQSVPSRAMRKAVGTLGSPEAGAQVARAIDWFGEKWHNTFLWDRIADLQAGIYKSLRQELIEGQLTGGKPVDPLVAGKIAGHFSNRFAGALAPESMSQGATNFANLVLFSRTFTLSNMGTFKDMVNGLPRNVRAQIGDALDEVAAKGAKSIARRKAWAAFMVDAGLYYAVNAIGQSAFDNLLRDKSMNQIEKEYVDRFWHTVEQVKQHPVERLNPFGLFGTMNSLLPQSGNEPGKQDRVFLGESDKDKGTATYARIPLAKVSEDLIGWLLHPAEMFSRKESTFLRPLQQTITNDKGFGRPLYNPHPEGLVDAAENLGKVVMAFVDSNMPTQWVSDLYDASFGGDRSKFAIAKALGPLLGFSLSKGAPGYLGGPEHGFYKRALDEHRYTIGQKLEPIHQMYTAGKTNEAMDAMTKIGMDAPEQRRMIRIWEGARSGLSKSNRKFLDRHLDESQQWEFEHLNRP